MINYLTNQIAKNDDEDMKSKADSESWWELQTSDSLFG
ncbi:hypothetical protein DB29_00143 [Shouchella clausii]|jgi:hypothetical protein|nr:hypothetical protein DB29_00143 [Shouchella clausii]